MNYTQICRLSIGLLIWLISCTVPGFSQNNTKPTVPVPHNMDVNSYTGNLYHKRTDFAIPGKGLDIDITFSYNISRRAKNWGMGKGWTFSYNLAYVHDSLGIWIERADGRIDLFKHVGSAYIAPPGIFDTLVEYSSGHFYLKTVDNIRYYFENATHRRLTKILDPNANQITFTYTDSLMQTISDGAGHALNLIWSNGKLSEMIDNSCTPSRKVVYNYDTVGNPVKVINPIQDYVMYYYDTTSKIIGYADENDSRLSVVYNKNNAVTKIVSCNTTHEFSYLLSQFKTYVTEKVNGNHVVTSYQYDTLGRVIAKKGNCCGFNETYQYDNRNNIIKRTDGNGKYTLYEYDAHGNMTKETDMVGNSMMYSYDAQNNLIGRQDKNGNTTTYTYDAHSNLLQVNKPLGITEVYTYDANGNRLSFKDGNNKTTVYQYNSAGYLIKITDAENGQTIMTYDCNGNQLTLTDPNNHTSTFQYNALNRLIQRTDALGNQLILTYDKSGNLKTIKNPLNKTTVLDYDGIHRLTKVTSPLGIIRQIEYDEQGNAIKKTDGNGKTYLFTYNSRRQVLTETDPLGNTMAYEYDEAGNRTSIRNKRNGTTQYEYDDIYRLIKKTDALGGVVQYTYDANGNKLVEMDANGNVTSYTYDALNRMTKVTDPLNKILEYSYDGNGNLLTEKDKRGNLITYTYDNVNRPKTITNAAGGIISYTYDAVGNRLSVLDALNHSTTYTYDAMNRRLSEQNALGETTLFTYDAAGNHLTTVLPNGNDVSRIYDDDNRLTGIIDALGTWKTYMLDPNGNVLSEKDANNNTISYLYDALNRKVRKIDALGKMTSYSYDQEDNIISETDRNGHTISASYDILNRKIGQVDALGGSTTLTYDANGNQLSLKDARNNTTSYGYDALNRLIQETFADGSSRQYTYDENGNVKTRKDNNNILTQYAYDYLNRLLTRSYPSGANDAFTYDAMGRMLTATNANAVINFNYDSANRLLSETLNGKQTTYTYNVSSGIRTVNYPGGRMITEEYDGRYNLKAVKEGTNMIAGLTYDAADRLMQTSYANGNVLDYTYNNNDWITALGLQASAALGVVYTYDDEGNRRSVNKIHATPRAETYEYDAQDRLTQFREGILNAGSISAPITQILYHFDGAGNRTTVIKDTGMTTYTSNNINQYTSIANPAVIVPVYDASGNLLYDGVHTYAYDAESRLVSVDGGGTTYIYDALGRRIQKSTAGSGISFYYRGEDIIEERDAANQVQATYVYGKAVDDILSMRRNGNDFYYLKNTLGSVVAITDAGGAVVERYEYDPYGNPSIYTGNYVSLSASPIGNSRMFTGREYDIESGNYYYRARFYSPANGRFMQFDPLGYVDGMNLYEYVGGNTLNIKDPSGLLSEGALERLDWRAFRSQSNGDNLGFITPFTEGANAFSVGFASIEVGFASAVRPGAEIIYPQLKTMNTMVSSAAFALNAVSLVGIGYDVSKNGLKNHHVADAALQAVFIVVPILAPQLAIGLAIGSAAYNLFDANFKNNHQGKSLTEYYLDEPNTPQYTSTETPQQICAGFVCKPGNTLSFRDDKEKDRWQAGLRRTRELIRKNPRGREFKIRHHAACFGVRG